MQFKSYRKESRLDWGETVAESVTLNNEQIMTGAFLRIADATEAMAKNHIQLQSDLAMYKRLYEEKKVQTEKLHHRISALQGVITKLKKKIK